MRQEWSKVSVDLCVKTLSDWESRVKLINQSHGLQTEHSKVILFYLCRMKKNRMKWHKDVTHSVINKMKELMNNIF